MVRLEWSVNGAIQEDGHGTAVAPFTLEQLHRARHEIRGDRLYGDVPKASTPPQFWACKVAHELCNEQAGEHDQGHEIAAAIEGPSPSNEHGQIAHKQKTYAP